MKKTLTIIIVFLIMATVAGGIFWLATKTTAPAAIWPIGQSDTGAVGATLAPSAVPTIQMCYRYTAKSPLASASGNNPELTDRAWLIMNINSADHSSVIGEYHNLPGGTDANTGPFTGTIGPMDPKTSSRLADVLWTSTSEGETTKRQLKIQFGEGSANALFGVLEKKDDGTYVYKQGAKLTSGFQMSQVDCDHLKDIIEVEKYVRNTINSIASDDPSVGGIWYVTSVTVDPLTKTGRVDYEDGHMKSHAGFTYLRGDTSVTITTVNGKPYVPNRDLMQVKTACYAYHQIATKAAPYAVDESMTLVTSPDGSIAGEKKGIQKGPDMTNGYTGTLRGTQADTMLKLDYSYIIEGSSNTEQELYRVVAGGLEKLRYPLIEQRGMLVPDTTKPYKALSYKTAPCS